MLVKIPLSSDWQQINLAANFKNNRNDRIIIQQTPNAGVLPVGDDGVVITRHETFKIPADGNQYWGKTFYGTGEIINDPTIIVPVSGSGTGAIFELGSSTFDGNGSFVEITLASDPGVPFQVIIQAVGDETVVATVGGITVVYSGADKFRVYNSGLAGISFNWTALIN